MPSLSSPRDVIDLDTARDRRTPAAPQLAAWVCEACELSAGPFTSGEAAYLARQHDRIQHLGSPTATVTPAQPELIAS